MMALLKIARTALSTAQISEEQRAALVSIDPKGFGTSVQYNTSRAQNSIRAHSSNPDVGRSFDGNCVFLDEVGGDCRCSPSFCRCFSYRH